MKPTVDLPPMNIPGVGYGPAHSVVPASNAIELRPPYAIEGHEDEVYHELRVGARGTEPDYCAFLNQSWTFNRAMRWEEAGNGTLLCLAAGGALPLTGETRIADWFSDPVNGIRHDNDGLVFRKASSRQREAVVLPGLQLDLGRHPTLEVAVRHATSPWQVCVLVKGRSGPPLVASDWREGQGSVVLDLAAAWRRKGYVIRFAELHVALGIWTDDPQASAGIECAMHLPAQAAIVPCLPVIRTAAVAAREGMPVSAAIVGADGERLDSHSVAVAIRVGGRSMPLSAANGIWTASLPGLPVGDHIGELEALGAVALKASVTLRVTHGQFVAYDLAGGGTMRAGRPLGPLSGSYQGMVFARDVGTPREALVQGQQAWEAWDRTVPPGEHWHYWEALTEPELDERFGYLARCGWDLLHLGQGWGIWEKLDAGGHIAPHGAEQLALLLRVAARHGLLLLQALSHYPYGGTYTPVLRQYLEAGFRDADWVEPDSPFTALFHGYLKDFATLFRDETALFAMSTSGEGDIATGPERVNDTFHFMQRHMPNHLFVAEPFHRVVRLPREQLRRWSVQKWTAKFVENRRNDIPWEPPLAGTRTYWIGHDLLPEIDLAIEFKFLQLGPCFVAEGSWPCPHLYARFVGREGAWAATERYRRRVRDTLYLGLVHRNPVILTWDEQYTEDERIVLREARESIDWAQPFRDAPIAVRVDSSNTGGQPWGAEGRRTLARYEEFFSSLPVATRYLMPEEDGPASTLAVFDARQPYVEPALPAAILEHSPLRVSAGYRASYLWSADGATLLAYIYNTTNHECLEDRQDLSGRWHRIPQSAECRVTIRNLPEEKLLCRVYSLNGKRCVRRQLVTGGAVFEQAASTDDYILLVTRR